MSRSRSLLLSVSRLPGFAVLAFSALLASSCLKLAPSPLQEIGPIVAGQTGGGQTAPTAIVLVAVGHGGVVYTSPDGASWQSSTVNASVDLSSVVFSGTRWITVGGVAGNAGCRVYTSSDARTWALASLPAGCSGQLLDVAKGGGRLVAVGETSANAPYAVVSSDDGLTWTALGVSATTLPYASVVQDGSVFIAADDVRNVWAGPVAAYSTPGASAFATTAAIFGMVKNAHRLGSLFAMPGRAIVTASNAGWGGTPAPPISAYTANSGSSWTIAGGSQIFGGNTLDQLPRAMAVDGSATTLVAVGEACRVDRTTNIAVLSWSAVAQFMAGCSATNWYGVIHDGNQYVAVGTSGSQARLAVSATGNANDWTISSLPGADARRIARRN